MQVGFALAIYSCKRGLWSRSSRWGKKINEWATTNLGTRENSLEAAFQDRLAYRRGSELQILPFINGSKKDEEPVDADTVNDVP